MMTLIRGKPRWDLEAIWDEMHRWTNEFLRSSIGDGGDWWISSWTPAVDMYENDQAVMLKAELPGFSKDDVHIEVTDNVLTLKDQRIRGTDVKEKRYHRVERTYGAFQRSFLLPKAIDADKAEATFKDGVLELMLPKADEAKPKAIKVTG